GPATGQPGGASTSPGTRDPRLPLLRPPYRRDLAGVEQVSPLGALVRGLGVALSLLLLADLGLGPGLLGRVDLKHRAGGQECLCGGDIALERRAVERVQDVEPLLASASAQLLL